MWVGQDCVESTEALDPESLELQQQLASVRQSLGIAADDTLATLLVFGHEPCLLQHGDMLLHRSERHFVARRQSRYGGRLTCEHARDYVTPCGVGKRSEEAIYLRIGKRHTYNHMVVS